MLETTMACIDTRPVHLHTHAATRDTAGKRLAATEQAVIHRLWHSGYRQLHGVRCRCSQSGDSETLVILSGELSSFYMKQVAQEVTRCVAGIDRIQNQIEVVELE